PCLMKPIPFELDSPALSIRRQCDQMRRLAKPIRKVRQKLGFNFTLQSPGLYCAGYRDEGLRTFLHVLTHSTFSNTKRCFFFKLTAGVNARKARTVRPCFPITLPMSSGATRISI